jgi:Cu/Ag efflux protein CusF
MKINAMLVALALSLLAGASPAFAQGAVMDGQVTKVDQPAGKITIKHGPLKQFGMDEGMTMVFRAGDPDVLKTVKAGDKIKFVPERIDGQFTATKIEKAK